MDVLQSFDFYKSAAARLKQALKHDERSRETNDDFGFCVLGKIEQLKLNSNQIIPIMSNIFMLSIVIIRDHKRSKSYKHKRS